MAKKKTTAAAEPAEAPAPPRNNDPNARAVPQGQNTQAGEMTYTRLHIPNYENQLAAAAMQADEMTVAELKETAASLQVDTGGAKLKDELIAAVKDAARPTPIDGGQ